MKNGDGGEKLLKQENPLENIPKRICTIRPVKTVDSEDDI